MPTWFKALLGAATASRGAVATPVPRPAQAPLAIVAAALSPPEPAHCTHATLQADMAPWLVAQGLGDITFSEAHWRTFALATGVAEHLAGSAMAGLSGRGSALPVLYLIPILPALWRMEERRIAGQWLRHVVTRGGWPSERVALSAEVPADARARAPAAVLKRLVYHGALTGMPLAGMVLAAAACNDHALPISAPGDGAAGLLLTDEAQAGALGLVYTTLQPELARGDAVPCMAELARIHDRAIASEASARCLGNEKPRRRLSALVRDAAPVPPFLP